MPCILPTCHVPTMQSVHGAVQDAFPASILPHLQELHGNNKAAYTPISCHFPLFLSPPANIPRQMTYYPTCPQVQIFSPPLRCIKTETGHSGTVMPSTGCALYLPASSLTGIRQKTAQDVLHQSPFSIPPDNWLVLHSVPSIFYLPSCPFPLIPGRCV